MRLVHYGKPAKTKPQIGQLWSIKSLSEAAFRCSYHLAYRSIRMVSDLALISYAQEKNRSGGCKDNAKIKTC